MYRRLKYVDMVFICFRVSARSIPRITYDYKTLASTSKLFTNKHLMINLKTRKSFIKKYRSRGSGDIFPGSGISTSLVSKDQVNHYSIALTLKYQNYH